MIVIRPRPRAHRASRHTVAAFLGLALLGAVSGCDAAPRTPGGAGGADAPPGSSHTAGTIRWGACSDRAHRPWIDPLTEGREALQCASVQVPVDASTPGGPTLSLALSRLPARHGATASLVLIPGGPGDSGLSIPGDVAVPDDLRDHFDLVGFDPRGVGHSEPHLSCRTDGRPDQVWTGCSHRTDPALLRTVDTQHAVDDLDAIRAALGDTRLTALAFSYGTTVSSSYALRHPDRVRAISADGVVDLAQPALDSRVAQARGFQDSFDRWAADCARHRDCPVGEDPARSSARFRGILDRAAEIREKDPRAVEPTEIVEFSDSALLTKDWAGLTTGLRAYLDGDPSRIRAKEADDSDSREPAMTVIECNDSAAALSPAERRRHEAAMEDASPRVAGHGPLDGLAETCSAWPGPGTRQPARVTRPAGLPTLQFVTQTHDPTTPRANAVAMSRALGAQLVTRDADGHADTFTGRSECLDRTVADYLLHPDQATTAPVTCPAGT